MTNLYCMYDVLAGSVVDKIMQFRNVNEAIRLVENICSELPKAFVKDIELRYLGQFDDKLCYINGIDMYSVVWKGADYIASKNDVPES